MSAGKHTPGPWEAERGTTHSGTIATLYGDGEWWEIWSKNAGGLAEANARFIVQACNSHDELVEALAELVRLKDDDSGWGSTLTVREKAWDAARSALAKAQGEA